MMEEEGSNSNPNTKITKRTLNDLPEELLLHILTFLPTLDAVQTSLVSHKWRPLWSRVPSLNFNFQLFPPREPPLDTRQFYAEFVDRVLISRPNSPVHTFRLSFIYHDHYGSHVDSWVRSAVTHLRARELHLDFLIGLDYQNEEENENHTYDFPFSVLKNGCVEKLGLIGCEITLPVQFSTMRFGSIGSLILENVYLDDQTVKDLILGCPNLEVLELNGCMWYRRLEICSRRLRRVVVILGYFCDDPEYNQTVLVDCPNLCSINFEDCGFDKFVLENASSLVDFRVDFLHRFEQSYVYWSKVVRLLEQTPNLKHLNVQNWWFEFLTSKDSFPKSFMLYNLNHLELRTGFTQYDLVGMAALLKLCPNLETMVLDSLYKISEDESLPEELLDKPVEFSMPRLKQVTVKEYTGTDDEANFVKMLIRQEVVLEKIALVPGQGGEDGQVGEKKSLPAMVFYRKGIEIWKDSLLRNTKWYIDSQV